MPFLLNPYRVVSGGGGGGFAHSKTFTIDHTKCGGTDSTNWPLLILETQTYLKSTGNGGDVQSTSGFDIRPFSDSGLTTALDFELVTYVATTGFLEMHVRIPTLTHSTDAVIYLGYGNASLTTDGSSTSTWNTGYALVWHGGTSSALTLTDSTSNALTLTNAGSCTAAAGQINGAVSLNGSTQALTHADTAALQILAAFTVEAWINPDVTSAIGYNEIVTKGNGANRNYDLDLEITTSKPRWIMTQGGSFKFIVATSGVTLGSWTSLAGTYDGAIMKQYRSGVVDANTTAVSGNADNVATAFAIGVLTNGAGTDWFKGQIDEVRVSNVARSVDYLLSSYNNQNSPSTFYTIT